MSFLCAARRQPHSKKASPPPPHGRKGDALSGISCPIPYISPSPLSMASDSVFMASSSSAPSQIRVISVPHLIPAAITFSTLLATIRFSPHSMMMSLLNFPGFRILPPIGSIRWPSPAFRCGSNSFREDVLSNGKCLCGCFWKNVTNWFYIVSPIMLRACWMGTGSGSFRRICR